MSLKAISIELGLRWEFAAAKIDSGQWLDVMIPGVAYATPVVRLFWGESALTKACLAMTLVALIARSRTTSKNISYQIHGIGNVYRCIAISVS